MIVISIIGIISAVALPTYRDYVVRSKMAEPLAHMAEMKTQVSEYYAVRGKLPYIEELDSVEAIIERLLSRFGGEDVYIKRPESDVIQAIGYIPDYDLSGNPFIIVVIRQEVFPDNRPRRFMLRGEFEDDDYSISWHCEYFPSDWQHTRYLPSECRSPYEGRSITLS